MILSSLLAIMLSSIIIDCISINYKQKVTKNFSQTITFFGSGNWSSLCLFYRYYGGTLSEKVLGKSLKAVGVPRDQFIVSTKCGRYKDGFDFSATRVTQSIDESLERLQLDYVDILQCHDIEFGSLDQVLKSIIWTLRFLSSTSITHQSI